MVLNIMAPMDESLARKIPTTMNALLQEHAHISSDHTRKALQHHRLVFLQTLIELLDHETVTIDDLQPFSQLRPEVQDKVFSSLRKGAVGLSAVRRETREPVGEGHLMKTLHPAKVIALRSATERLLNDLKMPEVFNEGGGI
jgi:hypothetical protein